MDEKMDLVTLIKSEAAKTRHRIQYLAGMLAANVWFAASLVAQDPETGKVLAILGGVCFFASFVVNIFGEAK